MNVQLKLRLMHDLGLEILRRRVSMERLSNQALLIQNSSQKSIELYKAWFNNQSIFLEFVCSLATGLAVICQGKKRSKPQTEKGEKTPNVDILFVGHLVDHQDLIDINDRYYGDLPAHCAEQGWSVHNVWLNQTKSEVVSSSRSAKANITVLDRRLSIIGEFKNFLALCVDAVRICLEGVARNEQGETSPILFRRHKRFVAARHMNYRNMAAMRIGQQIANIAAEYKPKIIIYTFEGQAWERVLCKCISDYLPSICMIGYQHTVLAPGVRNINKKIGDGSDPSQILTAGRITYDMLLEQSEFTAEYITIAGSPKAMTRVKPGLQSFTGTVLGAPEGQLSEVKIIADWLLAGAVAFPEINFVLRLHPLTSKRVVVKSCPELRTVPQNFRISDAGLEEDLSNASWILYRGSSVVLNALTKNIRPIYVNVDLSNELTNIVNQSLSWCRVFHSFDQFFEQLKDDVAKGTTLSADEKEAMDEAVNFGANYFLPFDNHAIFRVINECLEKNKVANVRGYSQ